MKNSKTRFDIALEAVHALRRYIDVAPADNPLPLLHQAEMACSELLKIQESYGPVPRGKIQPSPGVASPIKEWENKYKQFFKDIAQFMEHLRKYKKDILMLQLFMQHINSLEGSLAAILYRLSRIGMMADGKLTAGHEGY